MTGKYIDAEFRPDSEFLETYDAGFCLPDDAVFIKEDEYKGKFFWGIYNSDGERIAVTDDRECAFVIARQNDLNPRSAH